MASRLEAQSFRNLVSFYADELRQIENGVLVTELFNKDCRQNLHKYDVLKVAYPNGRRRTLVTEKAKETLKEISEKGDSNE